MNFWKTFEGEKITFMEFFRRWKKGVKQVPIIKQMDIFSKDALLER